MHPPLTTAGMLESIWVPDHAIILVSLFLLIFSLSLITFSIADDVNAMGWVGFTFLNLSAFLFIGLIVFSIPMAFKPVLPDIVAIIGAIGYGIFAVYFGLKYVKTINAA